MYYAIAAIHVLVSLFLIVVVLLQSGKAADLAGAFGGLGSQTVFGPRGSATVLTRATTISAIVFMITSLSLSILTAPAGSGSGVLDNITAPVQETGTPTSSTPAAPATPGAPGQDKGNGTGFMDITRTGPDGKQTTQSIPLPPATPADGKAAPKAK